MQNLQALVKEQRLFFETQKTKSISFRKEQLEKLKRALIENENVFVEALQQDLAKPPYETFIAEMAPSIAEIDHFLKHLDTWAARKKKPTRFWTHNHLLAAAYEEPIPKGLSLILSPWNYPLNLSLLPLIGSIGAGNCSILKPSELSPSTSRALHGVLGKIFEPRYISVLEGDASLAKDLTKIAFDKIFFTGSTQVGREVMKAAAENLCDVTLELGGKSPAVFDDDTAGDEIAVRRMLWGKFFNAGQTCVAPDFALIPKKSVEKFYPLVKKILIDFFGDEKNAARSISRIVNRRHFDRLSALLNLESVFWGGHREDSELRFGPCVLNPTQINAPCMQFEIFGPILPVVCYEDDSELHQILNRNADPLVLYILTRDDRFFLNMSSRHRSGAILRNDFIVHLSHSDLSFGGVGNSGFGRYHGEASFHTFSHLRSVEEKFLKPDLKNRYWPYPKKISNILKRFIS